MLSLLRFVPWALIAAALVWGTIQGFKLRDVRAEFQTYKAQVAVKQAEAIKAALDESRRLQEVQDGILKDTKRSLDQARVDAAAAGDAASRLRNQLAKYRPAAPGDSCVAERNQANRLANVFQECADEYRKVAEAADRAIVKGLSCERAYESLRNGPAP